MTSTDWTTLITNSLWLLGLSMLFAVAGFNAYLNAENSLPRAEWLRATFRSAWARVGAYLFFLGMALGAKNAWEVVLWGVLGVVGGFEWERALKSRPPAMIPVHIAESLKPETNDASLTKPEGSLVRVAGWLARTELIWLMALSPFFLAPLPGRVWALLALPLFWIARWVATGHFVSRTPLDWMMLLLMVMVLVSLFATFDISVSLDRIMTLMLGVGLYYALTAIPPEASTARHRAHWTVWAYALAGGMLALAALLGTAWGNKLPGLSQITGILPNFLRNALGDSSGFNPNIVGGALLLFLPLQIALGIQSRTYSSVSSWVKWLKQIESIMLVALTAGTLFLTQSRAAFISAILGILLLTVLANSRVRLLILGAALVAGLLIVIVIGPQRVADKLFGVSTAEFSVADSVQSLQGRTEIWSRALYGIEDFPITGMGIGTFGKLIPEMYPSLLISPDKEIGHAHNQFLQAGLDLGLLGLVAYLAIWLMGAAMVVILWRRGWNRALAAGIGGCLLASLAFGMIDSVVLVSRPGIFFWALLGILSYQFKSSEPAKDQFPRTMTP